MAKMKAWPYSDDGQPPWGGINIAFPEGTVRAYRETTKTGYRGFKPQWLDLSVQDAKQLQAALQKSLKRCG